MLLGVGPRYSPRRIAFLAKQERQPDQILVAFADLVDIGDAAERFPHVTFIQTELGLTRQRNSILTLARDNDFLLFIDDDFFLDPQYLKITERFFVENPQVVASTGRVLADDVKGPGLTVAQAKSIVASSTGAQSEQRITPTFLAYGCNMCLRLAPIREHDLRFDETLPLYGWYEDWDFSCAVSIFRVDRAHFECLWSPPQHQGWTCHGSAHGIRASSQSDLSSAKGNLPLVPCTSNSSLAHA